MRRTSATRGNIKKTLIWFTTSGPAAAGNVYMCIDGGMESCSPANEVFPRAEIQRKGVFKNFYARHTQAPGVGASYIMTFQVNGVDTALTCTITGGAQVQCSDTQHGVVVNRGDLVSIKCESINNPVVGGRIFGSLNYEY